MSVKKQICLMPYDVIPQLPFKIAGYSCGYFKIKKKEMLAYGHGSVN